MLQASSSASGRIPDASTATVSTRRPSCLATNGTLAVVVVLGMALLAAVTYAGKWTYLWREWLTSVGHKRIGVMYVLLSLVMLLRGFATPS